MRRLRHASSRRLTAIVAGVAALALTVGIAQAALTGSGAVPAPKALASAILDAFNAPEPDGVTARIHFTNKLLASGSLPGRGASPLAAGADGRLWIAKDGRFRLELQSDAGDAQIVSDGKLVTVYDSSSNTVYRAKLPDEAGEAATPKKGEKLTLDKIQKTLDRLAKYWTVSDAVPGNTVGQESYSVRISPKDDGGLLGAAEVAWDAVRGAPLRIGVYAHGQSDPVLELAATEISYGAVSDADISASPPAGAKVTDLSPKAGEQHADAGRDKHGKHAEVTGVDAVQRDLGFKLAAPAELAGLPRKDVRLVDVDGEKGALSIYGEGLGAIAVFQHKAGKPDKADAAAGSGAKQDERGGLRLPEINIAGATGTEIATALGTVVTFERDAIAYVIAGSVPPVAAENAARGLK
jgi:outer membrane lipoprotein-sorting protein